MRRINERPITDYYDDEPIKIPKFMVTHQEHHVKKRGLQFEMDAYEVLTFIGVILLIYCIGLLDVHPLGGVLGIIAGIVMVIVGGIKNDRD